jgi:lipid-A-disaccharide synthase
MTQRRYFISAGEYSGDLLAAEVVIALRQLQPEFKPCGVVGPAMRQAGVDALIGIERLSTMGLSDVLKRLGEFKVLESLLLEMIDRMQPEFAVLVDFPGFHIRLSEQLKLRGIPVVQYIAPKLWAWGEKRVEAVRRNFDLVLGILPFEEKFFASHSINYRYVGCPHVDRTSKVSVRKEDLGFKGSDQIVAMLPGSRTEELLYILPTLVEIKRELIFQSQSLQFVIPVAPNIGISQFCEIARALGLQVESSAEALLGDGQAKPAGPAVEGIRLVSGMSVELLSIADVAVVASGTATLEAALLGVPMTVVYRMSAGSYQFAQQVVRVENVSLVNLLADKVIVTEYIQNIDSRAVAREMLELLHPTGRREAQMKAFDELRDQLTGNAAKNAATEILQNVVEA